jgi:hypothetical protein
MALWQYEFHVLPKESFSILSNGTQLLLDDGLFDDEPFWKYKPVNKNYFKGIEKILQEGKSWSKQIDLYGNQRSNCLEILFDALTNNVVSVSFRIDFTSDFEMVLREIIEFCISKELIILDEELQIIPLNYESINCIIENSPQVKKYDELRK